MLIRRNRQLPAYQLQPRFFCLLYISCTAPQWTSSHRIMSGWSASAMKARLSDHSGERGRGGLSGLKGSESGLREIGISRTLCTMEPGKVEIWAEIPLRIRRKFGKSIEWLPTG